MAQGPLPIYSQGSFTPTYNTTAAKVIKATPGRLARISVVTAGTAGNLTINDNNATGASNVIGNEIFNAAFGTIPLGTVITLDWPCKTGITVSVMPTAMVIAISYV